MKRWIFVFLTCFILMMCLPLTAFTDIGPKSSVRFQFAGIEGETYYGERSYLSGAPQDRPLPGMVTKILTVTTFCRNRKVLDGATA